MQIDFCIPIKDEEEILEKNLNELLTFLRQANYNFNWKVVGIINNSSDGSELICKKIKTIFPDKFDYEIILGVGKGGAIKNYWRQSQADILAFMDADLAVPLNFLDKLINPIIKGEADLVVGSRFVPGATASRSLKRKITSWVYVNISKLIVPHTTKDLQCGFKAISKNSFNQVDIIKTDDFWFFDTELVILSEELGVRVKEIAINWNETRKNAKKSKINVTRDGWQFIKKLFIFRKTLSTTKKQIN